MMVKLSSLSSDFLISKRSRNYVSMSPHLLHSGSLAVKMKQVVFICKKELAEFVSKRAIVWRTTIV